MDGNWRDRARPRPNYPSNNNHNYNYNRFQPNHNNAQHFPNSQQTPPHSHVNHERFRRDDSRQEPHSATHHRYTRGIGHEYEERRRREMEEGGKYFSTNEMPHSSHMQGRDSRSNSPSSSNNRYGYNNTPINNNNNNTNFMRERFLFGPNPWVNPPPPPHHHHQFHSSRPQHTPQRSRREKEVVEMMERIKDYTPWLDARRSYIFRKGREREYKIEIDDIDWVLHVIKDLKADLDVGMMTLNRANDKVMQMMMKMPPTDEINSSDELYFGNLLRAFVSDRGLNLPTYCPRSPSPPPPPSSSSTSSSHHHHLHNDGGGGGGGGRERDSSSSSPLLTPKLIPTERPPPPPHHHISKFPPPPPHLSKFPQSQRQSYGSNYTPSTQRMEETVIEYNHGITGPLSPPPSSIMLGGGGGGGGGEREIEVIEVQDTPDSPSELEEVRERRGERLTKTIPTTAQVYMPSTFVEPSPPPLLPPIKPDFLREGPPHILQKATENVMLAMIKDRAAQSFGARKLHSHNNATTNKPLTSTPPNISLSTNTPTNSTTSNTSSSTSNNISKNNTSSSTSSSTSNKVSNNASNSGNNSSSSNDESGRDLRDPRLQPRVRRPPPPPPVINNSGEDSDSESVVIIEEIKKVKSVSPAHLTPPPPPHIHNMAEDLPHKATTHLIPPPPPHIHNMSQELPFKAAPECKRDEASGTPPPLNNVENKSPLRRSPRKCGKESEVLSGEPPPKKLKRYRRRVITMESGRVLNENDVINISDDEEPKLHISETTTVTGPETPAQESNLVESFKSSPELPSSTEPPKSQEIGPINESGVEEEGRVNYVTVQKTSFGPPSPLRSHYLNVPKETIFLEVKKPTLKVDETKVEQTPSSQNAQSTLSPEVAEPPPEIVPPTSEVERAGGENSIGENSDKAPVDVINEVVNESAGVENSDIIPANVMNEVNEEEILRSLFLRSLNPETVQSVDSDFITASIARLKAEFERVKDTAQKLAKGGGGGGAGGGGEENLEKKIEEAVDRSRSLGKKKGGKRRSSLEKLQEDLKEMNYEAMMPLGPRRGCRTVTTDESSANEAVPEPVPPLNSEDAPNLDPILPPPPKAPPKRKKKGGVGAGTKTKKAKVVPPPKKKSEGSPTPSKKRNFKAPPPEPSPDRIRTRRSASSTPVKGDNGTQPDEREVEKSNGEQRGGGGGGVEGEESGGLFNLSAILELEKDFAPDFALSDDELGGFKEFDLGFDWEQNLSAIDTSLEGELSEFLIKTDGISSLQVETTERRTEETTCPEKKIKKGRGVAKKKKVKGWGAKRKLEVACKVCPFNGKRIVYHYVNYHPDTSLPHACLDNSVFKRLCEVNSSESPQLMEIQFESSDGLNCLFCNSVLERLGAYANHLSSHTGEFLYSCTMCNTKFPNETEMSLHAKRHKKERTEGVIKLLQIPSERPEEEFYGYLCKECLFFQLFLHNIQTHLESTGHSETDVVCIKFRGFPLPPPPEIEPPQSQAELDEVFLGKECSLPEFEVRVESEERGGGVRLMSEGDVKFLDSIISRLSASKNGPKCCIDESWAEREEAVRETMNSLLDSLSQRSEMESEITELRTHLVTSQLNLSNNIKSERSDGVHYYDEIDEGGSESEEELNDYYLEDSCSSSSDESEWSNYSYNPSNPTSLHHPPPPLELTSSLQLDQESGLGGGNSPNVSTTTTTTNNNSYINNPPTTPQFEAMEEEGVRSPMAPPPEENGERKVDLEGSELYRCAYPGCSVGCETGNGLKEHILICPHTPLNNGTIVNCYHCEKRFKTFQAFVEHVRVHGKPRLFCAICSHSARISTDMSRHYKIFHKISTYRTVRWRDGTFLSYPKELSVQPMPIDQLEQSHAFIVPRIQFLPSEINNIPKQAVFTTLLHCALCPYSSKVRSNILRHLRLHLESEADGVTEVPTEAPVNSAPWLERKELMFDKMTNLAGSSHMQREYPADKEKSIYPKYVSEQFRYDCFECRSITVDVDILKIHFKALHADITKYDCPHCSSANNPNEPNKSVIIPLEKMTSHLKLHGPKLLKCGHCEYLSVNQGIMEKHVQEKHPEKKPIHYLIRDIKDPDSDPLLAKRRNSVDEGVERWKCNLCKSTSGSWEETKEHCRSAHKISSQFMCTICSYSADWVHQMKQHILSKSCSDSISTPNSLPPHVIVYYSKTEIGEEKAKYSFWRRDKSKSHLRGIYYLAEESENFVTSEKQHAAPVPKSPNSKQSAKVRVPKSPMKGKLTNVSVVVAPIEIQPILGTQKVKKVKQGPPSPKKKVVKSVLCPDGDLNKNINPYTCPKCKTYSTMKIDLLRPHLIQHLDYSRFVCALCENRSWTLTSFKAHIEGDHGQKFDEKLLRLEKKNEEYEYQIEQWMRRSIINTNELDAPLQKSLDSRMRKSNTETEKEVKEPEVIYIDLD